MAAQINYQALNELAQQQEWWFTASECYGLLTALICFKQFEQWPIVLFNQQAIEPQFQTTIQQMGKHIEDDLKSHSLQYQLLLPEQTTLNERAEALTYWAEGFIVASTHAHHVADISSDKESNEFLADLQEIVQLDTNLPDTEQNMQLLTELEEHCRMGALLVYASTRTIQPSA